jgi:hypothetical protein
MQGPERGSGLFSPLLSFPNGSRCPVLGPGCPCRWEILCTLSRCPSSCVLTGSKMLVGGQSKSRCYPASLELGHQPRMSLVPKPECQDGKVPLTPCLLCVCWACTACCTGRLWPGAPEGTHPLFPPSWCAQGKTISRECICTLVTLPLCFWEFLS